MSRARELSRLANANALSVASGTNYVGVGSTSPEIRLDVLGDAEIDGNLNVTGVATVGILTASTLYGDATYLTGIPAGLGTALSQDITNPLNKIYYTNQILGVGQTVTVNVPSTSNVAYTQYSEIAVEGDADLIVSDGDDLIADILGISTDGASGLLAGGGGRVRADNITNKDGTGAPTFPAGAIVSGIMTATDLVLVGNLTVEGTQTIINTQILDVEDRTIGIASTSTASNTTADGAGIVVYGGNDGNKSITWDNTSGNWIVVGGGISATSYQGVDSTLDTWLYG